MKFAENRPVKIVMLGAGGTGGRIAPEGTGVYPEGGGQGGETVRPR